MDAALPDHTIYHSAGIQPIDSKKPAPDGSEADACGLIAERVAEVYPDLPAPPMAKLRP
jgi:hypothetical protein